MHHLTPLQIATIPLISAFVGWITNLLAVRMLFRPRRAFRLFGIELQGLVPRRQAELAVSIGQTVERHLIGLEDVRQVLARPETLEGIHDIVRQTLAELVDHRLKRLHPMASVFLTGSVKQKLQEMLLAEVEALLPTLGERVLDNVADQLDFQRIVEERVRAFDLDRLEAMILDIAGRELRAIELLGGVLGFLIGLVQLAILAF
jgi:uncharacterized membrane protein YheB (UPF0754 family)